MNADTTVRTDLGRRAAGLVPVLRSHAQWGEDHRALHDETLEALADAGVFTMRVPTRYGGQEADAATFLEVITQLGLGDGSAAWNVSAWSTSAWMAAQFPDHVQDEVFAPGSRVCGVLSPTAAAVPNGEGVVINGRWQFISGAKHSQWQVVLAMAPTPDGASQWPVMAVVPMAELSIDDDWFTTGLCGTGSVTTIAQDVFVPQDRVLPLVGVLQEQTASKLNAESAVYRTPLMVTGCATFTGAAIGLARAAQAAFMDRLDHKITYTDYASRREAPITHLKVAEAALLIEEAESHATRLAAQVDAKGAAGEAWSLPERVKARAYLGRVFQLTNAAATALADESGGSSLYQSSPIQRAVRDLHALSVHALMHASTSAELYGRILCGLEPNTMYL
jgi:alkylation response protein AidB-like acyl-CoA dehydrogenase